MRARIGQHLRSHHSVCLRARVAANRTRRSGCLPADCKLIGQEMPHPALVHHQQYKVGVGGTDLKTDTAAFNPHGGRGAPTRSIATAYRKPTAILRAKNEPSLLHARYDNDTSRLVEQAVRDS